MSRKPASTRVPAYSYIRWSATHQRHGDSLDRQTEARDAWLGRHPDAELDTKLNMRDEGVSGWSGAHRENPDRNALAAFLELVKKRRIPRGSYLLVENLDRLSREHIRPALTLLLNLIEAGIRVVQLLPVEHVFDENVDPMMLMVAIMELSRGHSESQLKSDRVGKAWRKLKTRAAETREPITNMVPSWLRVANGKFELIEGAAAAIRRAYQLAIEGHGITAITNQIVAEKFPPFGRSGGWSRATVAKLLQSRRVCGVYQPRRGSTTKTARPDGPPIANYYPAVVTEAEWQAARAALGARRKTRGPAGKAVYLWGGLLKDARDGQPLYRSDKGANGGGPKLVNKLSMEGKGGPYVAFPLAAFEAAVLSQLREIDPRHILGTDAGPDQEAAARNRLLDLEGRVQKIQAQMVSGDEDVGPLVAVLRKLEEDRAEAEADLASVVRQAATPAADAWAECRSLLAALDTAEDPHEARLRLRSALRQMVAEIRCLFVARGMSRLAAVQVRFVGGRHRDYLVLHKPPHGRSGTPGASSARSFAAAGVPGEYDLRDPKAAAELESLLAAIDPAKAK